MYHCIQEFNAILQIGLCRTEESKLLFPNGLLHAQTVIVSLWQTEKEDFNELLNLEHEDDGWWDWISYQVSDFEEDIYGDACENVIPGPGLTDAVLQLSALVYVRETQKVFPFSTSSFTISIITYWTCERQKMKIHIISALTNDIFYRKSSNHYFWTPQTLYSQNSDIVWYDIKYYKCY